MIAPIDVPTILAIRAVAPALALGNAVILEPDPRTAISGGADVGEALVVEPAVRVIAFTGSTGAGRAVGALAGQHLKRTPGAGGDSALIVLADADVAEEFMQTLTEEVAHLPVGDPFREQVALGPLIDAGQRDRVDALVTASTAGGATVRTGGTHQDLFYRPTVLGDVPVDAPACTEEIFGPVAPVTPFTSLDEAVAPFGGVGASGTGSRHGGAAADTEALTETQWVTLRAHLPTHPF